MPELFLKNVWANVNKEWKIAWISTFVIGLLTHLYVMTNTLPNHDGLVNIYHSQMKFSSGRFFLGPFSGISSYFDLPWINGLLSIIYLALMTVLLVEIFRIQENCNDHINFSRHRDVSDSRCYFFIHVHCEWIYDGQFAGNTCSLHNKEMALWIYPCLFDFLHECRYLSGQFAPFS